MEGQQREFTTIMGYEMKVAFRLIFVMVFCVLPLSLEAQKPIKRHKGKSLSTSKNENINTYSKNNNEQDRILKNLLANMVFVEGGDFLMGSDSKDANKDERPVHTEKVKSFYIGKYEVTQKEWKAIMGKNPSTFIGDDLPVENVNWEDCQKFIGKLNQKTGKKFRLPTEAEWEYAAKGGRKSKGYTYSGSNELGKVAWYNGNSGNKTHRVGIKTPNELGLYDMSGNVWEYTFDSWSDNYSAPRNSLRKVRRGGSWEYAADGCRITFRVAQGMANRRRSFGLRLAL